MLLATQFIALCLFLISSNAFADWQLNLNPGVTPVSHDIYQLHMTILWICVAIGVLVFSVIFYSILYHRKSKGAKAAHFHEHFWLEITWTILPLLILIMIAIPATRVLKHMNNEDDPEITIKVTGHQWKWEYEYLDQGIHFFSNMNTPYAEIHNTAPKNTNYLRTVDHPLVIPIHKKIRFLFTSSDVIHAWFVPALGVQRDTVPGYINESWARINRPGTYYGQCNKLCGINHAYMPIVVIAMSEKDFTNWVTLQKGESVPTPTTPTLAPATPTNTPPVPTATTTPAAPSPPAPQPKATANMQDTLQKGEQIYLNTCSVCHQATGLGLPPTYPALKGSKIATGPLNVHLNRVLNGKPGTAMQAFKDQLSDEELAAVITYERNAWENNTKDLVTADEVKAARAKPPLVE